MSSCRPRWSSLRSIEQQAQLSHRPYRNGGVPTLLPTERFAATLNYGNFLGQNGFALNTALRLADNVQLTGGIGYGADEHIAGGRVGLRVGW